MAIDKKEGAIKDQVTEEVEVVGVEEASITTVIKETIETTETTVIVEIMTSVVIAIDKNSKKKDTLMTEIEKEKVKVLEVGVASGAEEIEVVIESQVEAWIETKEGVAIVQLLDQEVASEEEALVVIEMTATAITIIVRIMKEEEADKPDSMIERTEIDNNQEVEEEADMNIKVIETGIEMMTIEEDSEVVEEEVIETKETKEIREIKEIIEVVNSEKEVVENLEREEASEVTVKVGVVEVMVKIIEVVEVDMEKKIDLEVAMKAVAEVILVMKVAEVEETTNLEEELISEAVEEIIDLEAGIISETEMTETIEKTSEETEITINQNTTMNEAYENDFSDKNQRF